MEVSGQRHAPAAFTPGKDPVPIEQEAGWVRGPVWIVAENLAFTGIRSPDLPARNESLYRLSYPGPQYSQVMSLNMLVSVNEPTSISSEYSCSDRGSNEVPLTIRVENILCCSLDSEGNVFSHFSRTVPALARKDWKTNISNAIGVHEVELQCRRS
jgi:hypothetical protein